jgi:hypothetical protein
MHRINSNRHEKVQETSISKRHPPRVIDEYAEGVAARVTRAGPTNEIAAQLRALVRHRNELCPAVREYLITKLNFAARRNSRLAPQLGLFAAQLAGDFPQHLTLRHDGRAVDQSHHLSSVGNTAGIPAAAPASRGVCALTPKAKSHVDADHKPDGIRQTQEAIS